MNQSPSYRIIVPLAAIYTLCLFLPTIDALATVSFTLSSYDINFTIAALIFPIIYPLSDSLTEVYGKKISYYISFVCYLTIIFFSLVNNFLLTHIDNKSLFEFIVNSSLIVTVVGPISYIVTTYININCIYKLKVRMRNRHFIIRSFTSSAISGFIMSLMVQSALYYQSGFKVFLSHFLSVFAIKLIVTIPYVYLAKGLVIIYRFIDNIVFEEYNKTLATFNVENKFATE